MKQKILILLCFFLIKSGTNAQNGSCGSTGTLTYPVSLSNAILNNSSSEAWYSLELDSGKYQFDLANTRGKAVYKADIYTGACGSLTYLHSDSIPNTQDSSFSINVDCAAANTTYYIKLVSSSQSMNISVSTPTPDVRAVGWFAVCPGEPASVWLQVTNPVGSWGVLWGPPFNTSSGSVNWTPTVTGTYNYTYTDGAGSMVKNFSMSFLPSQACPGCNYVKNPNFECINGHSPYYSALPNQGFTLTTDWYSPTQGSPDSFHTLYNNYASSNVGIPSNFASTVAPTASGNGYIGLIPFSNNNGREYVYNHLKCPLVAGQPYEFGVKIRFGDNFQLASSHFGAALTTTLYTFNTTATVPLTPFYQNTNVVNYSGTWVTLTGTVNGNSEEWLYLGNFSNNATTFTATNSRPGGTQDASGKSYYFLDEVYLVPVNNTLSASSTTITACSKSTLTLTSLGSGSMNTIWTNGTSSYTGNVWVLPTPTVTTTYTCNVVFPCPPTTPYNCRPPKTITVFVQAPPLIVANSNWVVNNPLTILGVWTVPGGATLTITNPAAKVRFADSQSTGVPTYLKVMPGGVVNILNGAELTSIDNTTCPGSNGQMWDGIMLLGNGSQTQGNWGDYVNVNGQGFVSISSSTISNARNGITTSSITPNNTYDLSGTGGVIKAYASDFINNDRDIQYWYYHDIQNPYENKGWFQLCRFRTNNVLNHGGPPTGRVSMWEVHGVRFEGCEFSNNVGSSYSTMNRGYGINTNDASYVVMDYCGNNSCSTFTQSSFINLTRHVEATNANLLRYVNIDHANFYSSLAYPGASSLVRLNAANTSSLSRNSFTISGPNIDAIYLNSTKYYTITSNTITGIGQTGTGMRLAHSKMGAHRVYRNSFNDLAIGIVPQFDNSGLTNLVDGLKMNCNIFNGGMYDIAMVGSTSTVSLYASVARGQGVANTNGPPNLLLRVRNQYGATSCGNMNKWYIDGSGGSKTVLHAANSQTVTQPDQPSGACKHPTVVVSSGGALNFAAHCKEDEAIVATNTNCPCRACCEWGIINNLAGRAAQEADSLQSDYDNKIDGGNTPALLGLLYAAGANETDLKTFMLANSPFNSDTALKAYFIRGSAPHGNILEVHHANRPVSDGVWQVLQNINLTSDELDSLTAHQALDAVSGRDYQLAYVNNARFNLQSAYARKLNYFLRDTLPNTANSIITLLWENKGALPDAKVMLVDAYANAGAYARAIDYADSLSKDPGYAETATLQKVLATLQAGNSKQFSVLSNAGANDILKDYASDEAKPGCWQARAILNLVFNTDMEYAYLYPEEYGERIAAQAGSVEPASHSPGRIASVDQSDRLRIYPNPNNGSFKLLFTGTSVGALDYELRDILGKKVQSGHLSANAEQEINGQGLENGIYFVTLVQDKKVIARQKLIVLK